MPASREGCRATMVQAALIEKGPAMLPRGVALSPGLVPQGVDKTLLTTAVKCSPTCFLWSARVLRPLAAGAISLAMLATFLLPKAREDAGGHILLQDHSSSNSTQRAGLTGWVQA